MTLGETIYCVCFGLWGLAMYSLGVARVERKRRSARDADAEIRRTLIRRKW